MNNTYDEIRYTSNKEQPAPHEKVVVPKPTILTTALGLIQQKWNDFTQLFTKPNLAPNLDLSQTEKFTPEELLERNNLHKILNNPDARKKDAYLTEINNILKNYGLSGISKDYKSSLYQKLNSGSASQYAVDLGKISEYKSVYGTSILTDTQFIRFIQDIYGSSITDAYRIKVKSVLKEIQALMQEYGLTPSKLKLDTPTTEIVPLPEKTTQEKSKNHIENLLQDLNLFLKNNKAIYRINGEVKTDNLKIILKNPQLAQGIKNYCNSITTKDKNLETAIFIINRLCEYSHKLNHEQKLNQTEKFELNFILKNFENHKVWILRTIKDALLKMKT